MVAGQAPSLAGALWFRTLIVFLALGTVAGISLPYVIDAERRPRSAATVPEPAAGAPSVAPLSATPAEALVPRLSSSKLSARPSGVARAAGSKGVTAGLRSPDATRAPGADYWLQIGAYREASAARLVAVSLERRGFHVAESVTSGGSRPAAAGSAARRLHRVRVGTYPSRTAAQAAVSKLETLGYAPFVARGAQ